VHGLVLRGRASEKSNAGQALTRSWCEGGISARRGLFAAGWWDDTANLELLIHAGARIDIVVGVTPFLASWCWKKFKAAKLPALNGANVNFRDDKGRTALHHGVEKEFDPSVLRWLVNHGASPEIKDREGMSARLRASRKRDKRFLAALIL
jgi:hypothetical protein